MESDRHKKVANRILYWSGAQPTEPSKHHLFAPHAAPHGPNSPAAPRKEWHRQPRFVWPIATAATLLVIVGVWWAAGPQLVKAQVGNKQVMLSQSNTALGEQLSQTVAAYKLPVQYTDGQTKQYPVSEVGFRLDTTATLHTLREKQHGTLQRFAWWRPIETPLALSSDPHVLRAFIAGHITASVQPAQDATLTVENGEIVVHDGVAGKQYGLSNPQINLRDHVADLHAAPIKVALLTTNPTITNQELVASRDKLQQVLNQPVSFTIGSKKVTPSKSDIAGWLELTPDPKTKTTAIDVNSGKVLEYLNKIAKSSAHPARDQIEITHDDGSRSVMVAGQNGVKIASVQDIATKAAGNVLAGKGVAESLQVEESNFKVVSTAAYPKWIEVDVTNKRMYAYEQTTLIKSFAVTAGAPATPTVIGKYAIYSKYAQKDMRGNNVDGSKYFQPNVPWVSYFYRDYAIHGNYWRPLSYFGNINSSHGCVSIVPNEAAWMYDWAPIGTPVIIHT